MARRRRRSPGTWFPNVGSAIGETGENIQGRSFTVVTNPTGSIVTGILDLTFDTPFEGDRISTGVDSLSDIIGSEYILKRIVGKIYLHRFRANPENIDNQPPILVGCGFFVARANDQAVGGGEDTPIGSATEAERRDNYSPLEVDTVREPWIWRRTWILGAAGKYGDDVTSPARVSDQNNAAFPVSTPLYGSVMDGPHIDSRVKRRVGQDDRLWFAVSAMNYPPGQASTIGEIGVLGLLDYRIFGSLVKARNSSAF